jgi:hypothetical protein
MPIFMGRQDPQGVTAEAVATLHQEDLKIQANHGCRVLTYWFDEQRGTCSPGADAPRGRCGPRSAWGAMPWREASVHPARLGDDWRPGMKTAPQS